MRSENFAYIAGFIDGEGSIGLTKMHQKYEGKEYDKIVYYPRLTISNTNKVALEWIQRVLGGGHIHVSRQKGKIMGKWPKKGDVFYFAMYKRDMLITVLTKIIPFLHVKKKHAELLLEWCLSRSMRGAKPHKKLPYSNREMEVYERLYQLNKNGVIKE